MSEIKLDQSLSPSFTRASTAFTPDGTSVASGTPRYVNVVNDIIVDTPSEWDRGTYTRMSGLSYNLLTVNQSNVETNTTGFTNSGTATMAVSTDWAWQGTQSLKIMTASTSNIISVTVNLTSGVNLLCSAYAYNPGSGNITVNCNVAGNTTQLFTIPASGVVRIYASYLSNITALSAFRLWESTGQTFYVDGIMAEAVPTTQTVPSPWIVGGSYGVSLKAMPDFNRTNSAYLLGVDQGTKRPRFVGDVLEYGTTNLLTANQSSAETDLTGIIAVGGSAAVARSTAWAYNGTYSVLVTNATGTSAHGGYSPISFVSGNVYALSSYVYNPNATSITVNFGVAGNTNGTLVLAAGASGRITGTFTSTFTASSQLRFWEATGQSFHIDGSQVETNPSATSWILGGTSRVTTYSTDKLLIESNATNSLQRSSEFDNAAWTKSNSTITANAIVAPDGTLTADKLVETTATSTHYVSQVGGAIGAVETLSVFAKAGERVHMFLQTGGQYVVFNLLNGTVTNNLSNLRTTSTYIGDGWWRFTISTSSKTSSNVCYICAALGGSTVTYTGDTASGIYIWGAQAEVSRDHPTSYIPTPASSTVSRQSEAISIENKNILNTTNGAIVVRAYFGKSKLFSSITSGATNRLFRLASGTTSFTELIYSSASSQPFRLQNTDIAGAVTTTSTTGFVTEGYRTIGIRWSGSVYELWIDGVKLPTTSTPVAGLANWTSIVLGDSSVSASSITGWDDHIDYYHFYDSAPSTGEMVYFTSVGPTGAIYSLDFNNNLDYAASGIYTSEWFNGGVSGMVWTASGSVTTPTGTNALREYRTANSDTQADASAWSTTLGTGKYVQFRENLIATSAASTRPVVNSTTLMTPSLGKAIIIERAGTNLLTAPTVPAAQAITVTPGSTYALSFAGNAISSGAVQIQHEKIETSTADFGTGTLSNVSASSNALTLATAKADPTLTRATVAYLPDELTQVASGVARYASGAIYGGATNLITYSSDFSNTSYWSVLRVTISSNSNATAAPDGTWTADKLIEDTQTGAHYINRTSLFTIGTTNTISVYAKAGERSYLGISWAANVTVSGACFNLSNGTVATTAGVTASIQSVGNGWYRCMMTGVAGATTASFNICTDSAGTYSYTGDGTSGIYIWGAQAEVGSAASTYLPTNGAVNTRPTNMSVDRAIMVEEATTNLLQRSEEFDNAYWGKSASTITANAIVAPDGATTADKLIANTSAAAHYVIRQGIAPTGVVHTFSVYAKAGEYGRIRMSFAFNNLNAIFNLNTGAIDWTAASTTSSMTHVGNGWYRCSITATPIVENAGPYMDIYNESGANVFVGNDVDGIYIWGAQVEVKAYPTSYVATTSASVTRNAEVIQFTNTNVLPNPSVGSFIGRFKSDSMNSANINMLADLGGTGASGMWIGTNSGTSYRLTYGNVTGGISQVNALIVPSNNVWHTIGCTWGPGGAKLFMNGVFQASGSVAPNIVPITSLYYVGSNQASSRFLNGLISDWVLYREELSDTEMHLYTSTGSVIPGDYRTAYDLRFEDNLLHGEGGSRITAAQSLTNIGTITPAGTMAFWSETETAAAQENVVWENIQNVLVSGNSITRNGGTTGTQDAGAYMKKAFQKGQNFYVQFTNHTTSATNLRTFGLSNDISFDATTIDFAIQLNTNNSYVVKENSTTVFTSGTTYASGALCKIEVIDDVVRYYLDGVLQFTSTAVPKWPLYVVGDIFNSTSISGAVYGHFSRIDLDTSIDGGATWYSTAQSGVIDNIIADISASGKSFLARQKLYTPRSATFPTLNDITYRFGQKQTKGKHELMVPIYSSLRFTPNSYVTKWQTELRNYSSNMQLDGTARVGESFSISNASGIINPESGAVIMRIYVDEVYSASTNVREGVLFDCSESALSGKIAVYIDNSTPLTIVFLSYSTYGVSNNISVTKTLGKGWHTIGCRWGAGAVSLWADGVKLGEDLTATLPVTVSSTIRLGESFTGSSELDTPIAQFNAFREALTDAEMAAYTAAPGAVIPLTPKHTLQMNFEDNLKFGMTGIFRSRWLDAGSNCTDTPWVTYTEVVTKPAGTDIQYRFKASNTQSEAVAYDTDIASQTGRYIKLEAILMSDDAGTTTPTLTGIKTYPEYS